MFRINGVPESTNSKVLKKAVRGTLYLKAHRQIPKKRCFKKYCSCDKASQYQPLERVLSFKNFEKMQTISLYWLPAQQQTSALRRQNFGFFYVRFNAEF